MKYTSVAKNKPLITHLLNKMLREKMNYYELSVGGVVQYEDKHGEKCTLKLSAPLKIVLRQSNQLHTEVRFEISSAYLPIASGSQGTLFRASSVAKLDENGQVYALNNSKKSIKLIAKQVDTSGLENETNLFRKMHQNKCHLTVFSDKSSQRHSAAMVMKHFNGMILQSFLDKNPNASLMMRAKIARNLAIAIKKMHQKGIVHHDLNPSNMLIDADLNVKIIDFGYSKKIGEPIPGNTVFWIMAPERMRDSNLESHPKQDFFSFAGLLGKLFNATDIENRPFNDNGVPTGRCISNTNYDLSGLFKGLNPEDDFSHFINNKISDYGHLDDQYRPESLDNFIAEISDYIDNNTLSNNESVASAKANSSEQKFSRPSVGYVF